MAMERRLKELLGITESSSESKHEEHASYGALHFSFPAGGNYLYSIGGLFRGSHCLRCSRAVSKSPRFFLPVSSDCVAAGNLWPGFDRRRGPPRRRRSYPTRERRPQPRAREAHLGHGLAVAVAGAGGAGDVHERALVVAHTPLGRARTQRQAEAEATDAVRRGSAHVCCLVSGRCATPQVHAEARPRARGLRASRAPAEKAITRGPLSEAEPSPCLADGPTCEKTGAYLSMRVSEGVCE
jgi:hypothetical protein